MPHNKTILIIDDEIDLCFLLKDYFVRKGYDVNVAHSLGDGIDKLYSTPPDILFLDNNLPDGTGWSKVDKFAHDFPRTYFVLISAFHPTIPVMPEGSKYMAIEKPIGFADLDRQFHQF